AAGAHVVLELPRGGKIRAQDAGVERSTADVVAFSDANATLEPGALRELVAPFADPAVGYVCGQVAFVNEQGTNQEGLYWRYEMLLRAYESRLCSVTGGNGALYATRREAYLVVDPVMGHDLSFPFNLVRRGWRCVYRPSARATEKMVPSIEGEWARKRRMMSHAWPIVVRGGLLDPRGWPPRYALMIASHRWLRYAGPFLHLLSLRSPLSRALHAPLLAGALLAPRFPSRLLLVARYYVLTQASIALGLHDWLRHGTEAGWEQAEGTR
ncbi:MAG: glycosyltransferase, partial [Actinomycetota bacterium]|nr:glycosyltransferase [Actinomycetota bacterium]